MTAMDAHDPDCTTPLAGLIDRIVDGGLTPAQLRAALGTLDDSPDGWRRCALTFLEAQCWSESFRHLGESEGSGPSVISIPSPARRRWIGFALAACVSLAAFSLGWLGHSLRGGAVGDHRAEAHLVAASESSAGDGSSAPASHDPVPELPAPRPPAVREVARLRVGTGEAGAAEVPLLAGPGIDPRWLLEQPPPVSEQGRAAWQRRGYQLEQQRRVVSIPLGNGRRAAVPVDQVHVRYVGRDPL
jgi:hypothetical protein